MKNVLSQLHNIINSLQNNNLVKEAEVLDKVFTKLADRGNRWNEVIDNTERPELKNEDGEPNLSVTDYSLGRREDAIIQQSTAYQNLKNKWIAARDAYVASKKLSMMGNRSNQNKLISTYPNKQREDILRAKWLAAEKDLEIWYIGAFIQVKANKPVPQIMNLELEDITDEKRNRNRSTVKPVMKPTVKQVSKPVEETSKPSASKSVQKPVAPKPVSKPKQQLKEQVKPIQSEPTKDQIYFKAQMAFVDYQAKEKELGSKVKAYNEMQAEIYNADKTKGKQIYREWEKLVNSDNEEK